jgi:hypothetical protein
MNLRSLGKNMQHKWRGVVYKNGIDAGDTLGRHTFYRMLLVFRKAGSKQPETCRRIWSAPRGAFFFVHRFVSVRLMPL